MKPANAYVRNISAMLIFGSIGVFVQAIPLRSSEIVAARTLLGSLFLWGVLALRRQKPDWPRVKRRLGLLLLSGIVLGSNWVFLFSAYQYTSVSVATLLYYCAPVLVLFLSPLLFREKLTWPKLAGIAAAVIGMLLVNSSQSGGADPRRGMLFALLAAVFYAALILLNKGITDVPAVEKTLVQMMTAAAVMSLYAILSHSGPWQLPRGAGLPALLVIGFVHTGLAYLLYISSMSQLSGQSVALSSYIDPASALIFSALFLHEQLSLAQLSGAALILGGSAFGELYRAKQT